jgi:hypothetical protein
MVGRMAVITFERGSMEKNTNRKYSQIALMEMLWIGFGGSDVETPTPQVIYEPTPPPTTTEVATSLEKSEAEKQLEKEAQADTSIKESKQQGRKATILTKGIRGTPTTKSGGLLSYESMTGLDSNLKNKLGS